MLLGADLHLADKQNDLRNFRNGFPRRDAGFRRRQFRAGLLPDGGRHDLGPLLVRPEFRAYALPAAALAERLHRPRVPTPWATTTTIPTCRATPRDSFPIAKRWARTTIRSISGRCTTWCSTTSTGSTRAARTVSWATATTTVSCRWRRWSGWPRTWPPSRTRRRHW